MQSKKKNLLTGAVFIVCLGAGYGITRMLKPASEEASAPEEPNIEHIQYITSQRDTITRGDTILAVITKTRHYADVSNGDTIRRSDETIDVQEEVIDVPTPSPLVDAEEKNVQTRHVDNSTASSSGSHVVDKRTTVTETPKVKPALMSKYDFERLLCNTDDNTLEGVGSEKVSGHVRISVKGMRSDDSNKPSRVGGVRDKLSTGIWSSVKVVSVEADPNTGKIISATVEPVYP